MTHPMAGRATEINPKDFRHPEHLLHPPFYIRAEDEPTTPDSGDVRKIVSIYSDECYEIKFGQLALYAERVMLRFNGPIGLSSTVDKYIAMLWWSREFLEDGGATKFNDLYKSLRLYHTVATPVIIEPQATQAPSISDGHLRWWCSEGRLGNPKLQQFLDGAWSDVPVVVE